LLVEISIMSRLENAGKAFGSVPGKEAANKSHYY
jgi:hypothetical protein